jgi:membrane-bound lytic murein transglycosylase B
MTPRSGLLPKVITLVPLAALSVVAAVEVVRTPTADVSATVGRSSDQVATSTPGPSAVQVPPPGALVVPSTTPTPASVSRQVRPVVGDRVVAVTALAAPAIPPIALAAYQRAATVIDTADPTCHLDWSLIAAIGRVESDHGNHAGSRLDATGRATPDIIGPRLTGRHATLRVPDTDAGALDGDKRFDHAVGPMQFLPATWSTVGVDADGDGRRDPEDIDDAALAAAVYLCSGPDDLSTDAGRQAAVLRYNHSASYVRTVLGVASAYQTGAGVDTAVPALFLTRTAVVLPHVVIEGTAPQQYTEPASGKRHKRRHRHAATAVPHGVVPAGLHPSGGQHGAQPPASDPTPGQPPVSDQPSSSGQPSPSGSPTPDQPSTPAAATPDQLNALCKGSVEAQYPQATAAAHDQAIITCAQQLAGQTPDQATANVAQVVRDLAGQIDGLTPPTDPPSPSPTDPSTPATPSDPGTPTDPGSPSGSATSSDPGTSSDTGAPSDPATPGS